MAQEALLCVNLPAITAHRPVKQQTAGRFWIMHPKGQGDRATHAASHDPRRIDLEMIEQGLTLLGVARPTQTFDTPAGLAALAPVVKNERMLVSQRLDCIDSRPCARSPPFIDGGIEPSRSEQQNRRP